MKSSHSLSSLSSGREVKPIICAVVCAIISLFLLPVKSHGTQAEFSGSYEVRYLSLNNLNVLNSNIEDDVSYGDVRFVLRSAFAINENAKGVVALESGHTIFGIDTDNAADDELPGEDNINLKLKSAYVDFILPNRASNFIVGIQPFDIFHGILANEDAFGATYLVEAGRILQINLVKIFENKPDDEYSNVNNPQRTSNLVSISYENDIFKVDRYTILLGYYIDEEAIIDGVMYTKRKSVYYGIGYAWEKYGIESALNILYGTGRKKYIDNSSNALISEKNKSFLVDLISEKSFRNLNLSFEFLLATGDDNKQDSKDREFMSPDGLANFYDRAYILTGYITKDNADEKADIFDTSVYRLTNVVFFKLAGEYGFTESTRFELAVMHASHDKPVLNQSGKRATDIGAEIDATLSIDLFDTYYKTGKGLVLNFFGGYFIPSTVYENPDATDPDDVYVFGTGLEYTF